MLDAGLVTASCDGEAGGEAASRNAKPDAGYWWSDFGYSKIHEHNGGLSMSNTLSEDTIATLDAIADILLRCFIITVGAMIFVWIVSLALGDVIYSIHSQLIDISSKEFDLFFLYTMTFLKALNILFFGIPFVAIKSYPRGKR
jgi:ABC-type dipeptide/oligopeptide/nickel transport system permease component